FAYRVICPDTVTYDWFTATLRDNTTQAVYTIVPRTCTNTGAWATATYALTALRGHSVTLVLSNHDDDYIGDPTFTYVDEVSVPTVARRMYAIDTLTGAGTGLALGTRSDLYATIGLAPQDDGSYVMVKQGQGAWTACRFTLATVNGGTQ